MEKYDFGAIERKWQKQWLEDGTYEPDLSGAKKPFYNLMMFPYPSAEGLHVGNMYAFTGADIYGRKKRMEGYDVFEPIGLDGFGIHSENYALKIGTHPMDQAKVSQENFYRQLEMIGNGYAWKEKLETYDPAYYRWTQWVFVQLWKAGLAYRKKQSVNWCPKDMTVLADEQVIAGKCERCSSVVEKRDLEQWFFRITKYAPRLLENLEKIDWSERVKIAQRNWIGKSEGALIDFEIAGSVAPSYVLLHGYNGSPAKNFFPWLKQELEKRGAKVYAPLLPETDDPKVADQVTEVLKHTPFDKDTVLVGHSLGGVVALKVLEKLPVPVRRTVLVGCYSENRFLDEDFPSYAFDWKFDAARIGKNAGEIHVLRDMTDDTVPQDNTANLQKLIGGTLFDFAANKPHACGEQEPEILRHCIDSIRVFTTRPDTLFGATYMVLSPEHELVNCLKSRIGNWKEVEGYVKKAAGKSEAERIQEEKEKTGVELKGVKAINPMNKAEIPIFVADYVLSGYGTGAIMAVPAHDERDFEFAKKFKLPIKIVYPPIDTADLGKTSVGEFYEGKVFPGDGSNSFLVNSGKFDGMDVTEAIPAITKFAGGELKTQYRLRDWLISRQRYWGAPIPMIHCEACAAAGKGEQSGMPGWYAVPEKDLPVVLPHVKEFRPQGKGESPLASVKDFYEAKCPSCGGKARRETDVSDTFLDSAWYYLRYPSTTAKTAGKEPWDPGLVKKWFPVNLYTGGAEHAVLHLLYVRFVALALHDMNLLEFGTSRAPVGEPFPKFRAHGLLISEGAKMSKSKGNVVNPDEYIRKFGADALRMYLMFLAPFEQGGDFRDEAVLGITRFLERVWKWFGDQEKEAAKSPGIEAAVHKAIKKVTDDIEALNYNTAISALMICLNVFEAAGGASKEHRETFLKLLAPFAPHITEELWHARGNKGSIHQSGWPSYNPKFLVESTVKIAVQVNGKLRGTIEVSAGTGEAEVERLARENPNVAKFLTGTAKKVIVVPDRLVNFVI